MFDALGRITELRESRGLSVYKLAKISGVPQSTIVTWYTLNRYPSIDKLEMICDALGITLFEFFSDSEQLENGSSNTEIAELNSKYMILADHQKKAVMNVVNAFLHE